MSPLQAPSEYLLLFFLNFALVLTNQITVNGKNDSRPVEDGLAKTKWISELMAEGERTFEMDSLVNAKCRRDYDLYKLHLRNQSIWALRMMESSEWPSESIFAGVTYRLGNWYECLLVSKYNVTGQYCLVSLDYDTNRHRYESNSFQWPDEKASAWDALEKYKQRPWIVNRQHLTWAMCIPASCQKSDLERSLNSTLYPIFQKEGFDTTVNIDPKQCSTKNENNYSTGFYVICGFVGAVGILIIVSAIIDSKITNKSDAKTAGDQKSLARYILKSFSIAENYKSLIKKSSADYSAEVDFVKIINMICVIQAHRHIFSEGYPKFPVELVERISYSSDSVAISLRGIIIVDIFYMFSGFLTFHFGYQHMRKTGIVYLIQSMVIRWAKMVPALMVLMLIIIHVLPYLNEGPMWDYRVGIEVENCQYTFWENVLAISNIVKTDKMCLITSWYVSADIQLTLIGLVLVFIIIKNEKLGLFLTLLTLFIGVATTFIVVYVKRYHALLHSTMSFLVNPRASEEFARFYVSTYTRIAPYLVGFIAAILTKIKKEKNYRFSEKQIAILTILSILLKYFILENMKYFFDFVREYNKLEQALVAVAVRVFFVIPEAFLQSLCFTNNFHSILKFLSLELWIPLGRLLYCVFLVHVPIQLYHAASTHVLEPTFSVADHTWLIVSDVFFSFTAAFFLHLLIEAPMVNLTKLLLMIIFRKKAPVKSSLEKNAHDNRSFEKNEEIKTTETETFD